MSIEPIGIVAILGGLLCLFLGNGATVVTLAVTAVLGSAAAMFIGSANIQPGHVLLGFLVLGVITRERAAGAFVHALRLGEPGFWFALLVVYGVMSAYFAPRLLTGVTQIVPLGTTVFGDTRSTVPLVPVSSNFTQSVYMIGNLICFAMTVAVASTYRGFQAVLAGLLAYSVANTVFALLDIGTYSTGSQGILAFMRNAQYTLHTDDQIAGVKRIVGSFTEASSFARSTLGVFAFTGTLWLCGRRPYISGPIAAISLVLVVMSTSSTGLVGAPVMLLILFATALSVSGRKNTSRTATVAIVFVPLVSLAVALLVAIDPDMSKLIYNYIDIVALGKSASNSGIERNSWNMAAIQNVFDSLGLGVGLGTARTSSFLLALLANVGIPGTIFYLAFAFDALIKKRGVQGSFMADARLAARNGCLGLLVGDMLVSPVIDQGLFFCMLAAMASAQPERATQVVRASRPIGATI
ncbi:hypothetical protein G6L94_28710 [Agrobacterium rhizogenes]|uniref:Uncharacterized protein n=2 Tax=Rhizobium rhizogenes TaxID=359 RepID=B9JKJ6_RHIR8|nr:hypothetical protein [Rhizobium rhizogenes]ACM30438.1 conserved hypothetical protein [Rhizobium rhizogenes K84]OCJ01769.1 hypothetical protein A6U85_08915 [Agrobacterium sp. 13-626]OCJ15787.1 hypothetical protein A6U88_15030 [Agrobacterium sp. B131/95]OCJ19481.1 hypothetical protein A6U89_16010 [Agrobacterium sp. B133/95]KEA08832.1 hypothetical protein CN09_24515 [Rhizobium rhizogenes]